MVNCHNKGSRKHSEQNRISATLNARTASTLQSELYFPADVLRDTALWVWLQGFLHKGWGCSIRSHFSRLLLMTLHKWIQGRQALSLG